MVALTNSQASTFMSLNWQGTARAWTVPGGNDTAGMTNLPFGDGSNLPSVMDETFWFAGMELDTPNGTDSGTNHATFREYGNMEGRWMSPDSYAGGYDLTTPQSLNRYSYVLNNPLGFADQLGLDWTYDCGPNCVGVVGTDDGGDDCLWCWNAVGVGTVISQPPPLPPPPYQVMTRYTNSGVIAPYNQPQPKPPQPQKPEHFWQKPGCSHALGEFGVGLVGSALTTGAVVAAFVVGPEELVGFEGAATVLHVAPVGVPGFVLTAYGGVGVARKCF